VADPSQAGMQNRLMAGNLAGAVTARCRTELGEPGLARDMARRPDLPMSGCVCLSFVVTGTPYPALA